MQSENKEKLGLVLEGGGARGAYQAGVLQALYQAGYQFDGVTGTSIGALNGVMVAQRKFVDSFKVWNEIDFAKVLNVNNKYGTNIATKNIDADSVKYFYNFFKQLIYQKGVDTTNIKKIISDNIDENALRNSGIDFGVMTFSLTEKKPVPVFVEDMQNGSVADYVMASASFPGFQKTTFDDQTFIDGGIYDNMPVNMLIDKGYQDIIAIETKSFIPKRKPKGKNVQIHYFKPSEKPGKVMDFTRQSIEKAMTIGYFDALKALNGYVGSFYYIDVSEKTPFGYGLCDFDENVYKQIAELFQINYINQNVLCGVICKLLKVEYKNIADLLIYVFEKVANAEKIPRLKIYSIDDFIKLVATRYSGIKYNVAKKIEKEIAIVKVIGENLFGSGLC